MQQNRALERLRAGEFALGLQLRSRSTLIAELAGYLGFDYLYIETEHFACNDESIESIVRAAQLSGITPWLRITDDSPEVIGHMLDIGVQGIIVPHLETAEQAKKLVDAVKFTPLGHRGSSSSSRAAQFGCIKSSEFMRLSNQNCSAIGMIESRKGVENLESILNAGIDMIRVGRSDLSLDMGMYGKQNDPAFVEVLKHITSIANQRGVPVATGATSVEEAMYFKSLGFNVLNISSDLDHLKRTLPVLLNSIRESVNS